MEDQEKSGCITHQWKWYTFFVSLFGLYAVAWKPDMQICYSVQKSVTELTSSLLGRPRKVLLTGFMKSCDTMLSYNRHGATSSHENSSGKCTGWVGGGFEISACTWGLTAPAWSLTIGMQSPCCWDKTSEGSQDLREAEQEGCCGREFQMKWGVYHSPTVTLQLVIQTCSRKNHSFQ